MVYSLGKAIITKLSGNCSILAQVQYRHKIASGQVLPSYAVPLEFYDSMLDKMNGIMYLLWSLPPFHSLMHQYRWNSLCQHNSWLCCVAAFVPNTFSVIVWAHGRGATHMQAACTTCVEEFQLIILYSSLDVWTSWLYSGLEFIL